MRHRTRRFPPNMREREVMPNPQKVKRTLRVRRDYVAMKAVIYQGVGE